MKLEPPGKTSASLEDDVEMKSVGDDWREPPQNGDGHYHDDDDSDSFNDALLSPQGPKKIFAAAGELWSQIQSIVIESTPTLLFTTIGLLFTGELLDQVSHWPSISEVHQLIMIIPVILNLKGNLEMNLSARLGTAANLGELDDPAVRRSIISGNLSLLQVQAAVVSFIAAWIAVILGLMLPQQAPSPEPMIDTSNATLAENVMVRAVHHVLDIAVLSPRRPISIPQDTNSTFSLFKLIMVASSGMTAASLSSVVLGSFMCALIVVCRRYGRDPDNIAPPIATCLGDLVTLLFLATISSFLIAFVATPVPFIVGMAIVVVVILCFIDTIRNPHVRPLLSQGWTPLFGAMILSNAAGIVLDRFAGRYEGFALLSVVISGLPGSVGSILISRLSTSLHVADLRLLAGPRSSRLSRKGATEPSIRLVMMTLFLVTIPIEIVFLFVLRAIGWLELPVVFIAFSVVFFSVAVIISLLIAKILTNFLWSKNLDPDMCALPIHSALVDLLGHLILAVCYEIAQVFVNVKSQ